MRCAVLTPDKRLYDGDADSITFSTPEGRMGVLNGHMPMLAAVMEDTLVLKLNGAARIAAAGRGYAEINGDAATFYLETAEWSDEIDAARAQSALDAAERRMKSGADAARFARDHAAVARAHAKLKAV